MALIRNFRELNVYKLARQETQRIFARSRGFPAEEKKPADAIFRSANRVRRECCWSTRQCPADCGLMKMLRLAAASVSCQQWNQTKFAC